MGRKAVTVTGIFGNIGKPSGTLTRGVHSVEETYVLIEEKRKNRNDQHSIELCSERLSAGSCGFSTETRGIFFCSSEVGCKLERR
jgi:hypothetical protein